MDDLKQLTCEYQIGSSLYISIPGIGTPDTAVTLLKSDWKGDYYATFGLQHGCICVKPGALASQENVLSYNLAFISPKNGKVYETWQACKAGL